MNVSASPSLSTPRPVPPTGVRAWLGLLGWIVVCLGTAAIAGLASRHAPDFYMQLDRPPWAPPAAVFGPVWTLLYGVMAVAAWLVWRVRGWAGAAVPLLLFLVQLVANALWSWLFFGWQRGALAVADIVLLWLLIVATLVGFWRVRRVAGVLLVPYLVWVSFAAALCWSIWQRNPQLL